MHQVPNRRSMIVLGGLIGAMTVASGLLLLLEPGPIAPPPRLITLRAAVTAPQGDSLLFDTTAPPRHWRGIVIYESGSPLATAGSLAQAHTARGFDGLGYHFVIEQPQNGQEPTIAVGYRWPQQTSGVMSTGTYRDWYNQNTISICLSSASNKRPPGDMQMRLLVDLVQRLQRRYTIGPRLVRMHADTDVRVKTGQYFPLGYLRQRLLSPAR